MNRRWLAIPALLLAGAVSWAEEAGQAVTLAAVLKIAGADSTDVLLAQERSLEARARYHQAQQKYLPWLTPGLSYRRVDGQVQDVRGDLVTVDKQSFGLGLSLTAEIAVGEAMYESLITRRRLNATEHDTQVARQQVLFDTRRLYFALVEAQAKARVAAQAVQQASDYAAQVQEAQGAGLASAGELSRASAQVQRRRLQQAKTQTDIQVAAVRLAEVLRLQAGPLVHADDAELQPMIFVNSAESLNALVIRALVQRAEMQAILARRQAADAQHDQAAHGALIPRVVLRGAAGGLGGGRNDEWGHFASTSEVAIGVEWRIGPGGLFDSAQQEAVDSQARQALIQEQRLRERITREVQESYVVAHAASEQIALAQSVVQTTEQALQLARNRRDFGIAAVLEVISADEEVTRAREDYIEAVSRHNQGQSALLHALGPTP